MRLEKILSLALVLCVTAVTLPAEDKPEAWMGDSSGAQNIYSPNEIKEDLTFLKPLELGGMAAGAYLACRSGIMSRCMDSYRLKTDVWSVVGNTGLVIVTAFAGTVLGGVTTAFAFGPMDPEFETIKEKNLPDATRLTMVVSGALLMGAGGYIGYRVGGEHTVKYGEEIIIGSLVGAIVGDYIGEQLGNLFFVQVKKKKK